MADARAGYTGARLSEWFREEPLTHALRRAADEGGKSQTSLTKAQTPLDTGHLAASIKQLPVMVYSEGPRTVYESGCETTVEYAPYVEHGTGLWGPKHAKYVIRPKNPGGYLRFVDNGKVVFAKQVMHPGSPGAHMFDKGAAEVERLFDFVTKVPFEVWAREQEVNDSVVHYPGGRL